MEFNDRRSKKAPGLNQMALPGLEDVSPHPGARVLAQGFHFDPTEHVMKSRQQLRVMHGGESVGSAEWRGLHAAKRPGEILFIHSKPEHRRQGIATALYNVGRQFARVKPLHSPERTYEGDAWARTTGGRLPKNRLYDPAGDANFDG